MPALLSASTSRWRLDGWVWRNVDSSERYQLFSGRVRVAARIFPRISGKSASIIGDLRIMRKLLRFLRNMSIGAAYVRFPRHSARHNLCDRPKRETQRVAGVLPFYQRFPLSRRILLASLSRPAFWSA